MLPYVSNHNLIYWCTQYIGCPSQPTADIHRRKVSGKCLSVTYGMNEGAANQPHCCTVQASPSKTHGEAQSHTHSFESKCRCASPSLARESQKPHPIKRQTEQHTTTWRSAPQRQRAWTPTAWERHASWKQMFRRPKEKGASWRMMIIDLLFAPAQPPNQPA